MKQILILFILISNIYLFAQNCPTGNEKVKSINQDFEKEVLKLTNKERKKRGLKKLKWNETLAYSARYHAQDMAEENYFEHSSFDRNSNGKLKEVCGTFDRVEAFIVFNYLAENISAGQVTPEAVVKSWMKSPGHRKNILGKNFSELGVGFYQSNNSEYEYYWVQNFGGD